MRTGFELDSHGCAGGHLRYVGNDQLVPPHRRQRQIQVGKLRERTRQRAGGDHDPVGPHRTGGRGHAPHPATFQDETGRRHAGVEAGTARPRQLQGQPAWLEPAVTLAKAGVHDIRGQVGKALPRLHAAQQLDIGQPPLALRRGQVRLDLRALIRPGDEQVALVEKAHIHALVKLVEEGDAFPNQLDFFRVVELQPEGAGRHRRGERRQRRPLLENARAKPGALRKQRGRATDDPPTDDDEVGGVGR